MLPGETEPRPKRSLAAIACLRLRLPKAGHRSKKKKRTADEAGLGAKDESADDTGMAGDVDVKQEEQDSAYDTSVTQDEDVRKGSGRG